MKTEVRSLRDFKLADADAERDVRITRPGPWGNPFSVERHGMRRGASGSNALDKYRRWLADIIARANRLDGDHEGQRFVAALRGLAGKRLWCACTAEAIRHGACHGVVLAKAVEELTDVPVELAPGGEES
jgi:hypothetical protein